jgi:hypothetical protein
MFIKPLPILETKKREKGSIRAKKPRFLREIEGCRENVFFGPLDFPKKTPREPEGSIRKCRKNKVGTHRSLESRQMGKPNYPWRAISEFPPFGMLDRKERNVEISQSVGQKTKLGITHRRAIAKLNCNQKPRLPGGIPGLRFRSASGTYFTPPQLGGFVTLFHISEHTEEPFPTL